MWFKFIFSHQIATKTCIREKLYWLWNWVIEKRYPWLLAHLIHHQTCYRSGPVNSNTVNSKLLLNSKFFLEFFARLLPFHVKNELLIRISLNSKQNVADEWLRINRTRPVLLSKVRKSIENQSKSASRQNSASFHSSPANQSIIKHMLGGESGKRPN